MKCISCGKLIEEDVEFCYFCGNTISDNVTKDNKDNINNEKMDNIMEKKQHTFETNDFEKESDYIDSVSKYAISSIVGIIIKILSIIVLVFGVIGAFVIMEDSDEIGMAVLVVSILTGVLTYGIGEIVCLLTSINHKIK